MTEQPLDIIEDEIDGPFVSERVSLDARITRQVQEIQERHRRATFRPTPFKYRDPATIEPRDWLYDLHYIRKFVVADIAPGGTIKTSNALVEAIAMATGIDLLNVGDARMPTRALKVWYWSGEDTREEIERRLAGIIKFYSTPDDLGGVILDADAIALIERNLFIDTGRDVPIKLAVEDDHGFKIAVPTVQGLKRALTGLAIDVLIIDPFVDSHSVSENDNTRIEGVVSTWRGIAEDAACCVNLVHHSRKAKAGASMEYGADDARGASALKDAARSVRVYNMMTADEADAFKVPKADRWRYVRAGDDKPNMAARGILTCWRYIASEDLGNSRPAADGESRGRAQDSVGVVTMWEQPIKDPLTTAVLNDMILKAARKFYDDGIRITSTNGRNRIAKMVGSFQAVEGLERASKMDIEAALEGACKGKSPTWGYRSSKDTSDNGGAGYCPLDAITEGE